MKTIITLILATFMLSSCSSIDVSRYKYNTPSFSLFEYFEGEVKGWGIVQDRKGIVSRQFSVNIIGTINDNTLQLEEDFYWSDGEKSKRIWTIHKTDEHIYTGEADDVVGHAKGESYGNALHWQYHLNLEVDDSTWKIHFNDWMFLQEDGVLLNRASMSKFGFGVGEVTIAFQKIGG